MTFREFLMAEDFGQVGAADPRSWSDGPNGSEFARRGIRSKTNSQNDDEIPSYKKDKKTKRPEEVLGLNFPKRT